jgi:protoporphyrinogen oxidase
MERFDLIIVGGGISGLGLAAYGRALGLHPCVLEAEQRVGGALHSHSLGDGFWIELGAHTVYNSYGHLAGLLEDTGLLERLLPRVKAPWMLWEDGRPHAIPGRLHKLELLRSLPRIWLEKREGHSVEAYYSRVLGRRNYREVARAMFSAVVSQEAGGFPADALFKKRPRRKDLPRSFAIEGGLGTIPAALAGGEGLTVRRGCPVTEVTRSGPGEFRVRAEDGTEDGSELETGMLALATPPDVAASLLAKSHPEVSRLLSGIPVRTVESMGAAVSAERTALPSLAGLVALDEPFYSVVSRDILPHPDQRGFTFHFKPGVEQSEREGCIAAVLGVPKSEWLLHFSASHRLPSLALGHGALIREIDAALDGSGVYLTGNYFAGLAIEDCLTRSASESERLKAAL